MNTIKKTMVKNMALGALAFAVVLAIPKLGEVVSDAIAKVRVKIGG